MCSSDLANPKRYLPYTGMPVNIPFDKPVSQDLYRGSSEQQVAALTDLLMHFDAFAKRNLSLEAFLKQQPPPAAAPVQPPPKQSQAPVESGPPKADARPKNTFPAVGKSPGRSGDSTPKAIALN